MEKVEDDVAICNLVIWWRCISFCLGFEMNFRGRDLPEKTHSGSRPPNRSQSWSLLWWNCGIPGIIYTTRNLWWRMVKHNHSMNLYNYIKQLKKCEAVVNTYAQLRGGYLVPFLPFQNWGSRPQRVDRSSDQEHRTGQEPAKRWTQRLEIEIEQTIVRENTRCEFSGGKVFLCFCYRVKLEIF